ncbi:hypothetical protein HK414_25205 [Ramlibacter terrae]|uniref:Peptidase M15A C-terminal domain-containing protein n=1 Tax=Ramlibacter terrae TaxID=2732511 RepID=A0ABX6P5T2_9BURK|nr:hypothetical protein HK414_25205 [Ramlibacter terrae]
MAAARGRAARRLAAAACALAAALPIAGRAADDERNLAMFRAWLPAHQAEVQAFETFPGRQAGGRRGAHRQLLRSASMWRECKAQPFQLPPPAQWQDAGRVLALLRELRRTGVLGPFAVMSAYRDPALNQCAGGAGRSSHMRSFAVDFVPLAPWDDQKLCAFWREQGRRWDMGLSRYPSGRIHIDRTGWRTGARTTPAPPASAGSGRNPAAERNFSAGGVDNFTHPRGACTGAKRGRATVAQETPWRNAVFPSSPS